MISQRCARRLCKPSAAKLLAEIHDDPICDEPNGGERAKLQDEASRLILRDLDQVLPVAAR